MSRIRSESWMTALLLVFAAMASSAQQSSLTLRQAIDRALGHNPQSQSAQADVSAAQAGASIARTGLLPRLNMAEDISRGNDPVYVFGTLLRQQRFSDFALNTLNRPTPIGNFATRLNGQWMLFNGLETERQIRGARLDVESAQRMSEQVNQGVVLQAVEAYQAVLYAQREIGLAQHAELTAAALLRDAQTRVKSGVALDSDLLSAQVNLAERQQDRIAAEGAIETAWAELEAAMGGPLTPRPALQPIEAKSFPQSDLAADIAQALKARPDLSALHLAADARQQLVKAARSDLLPQVSAYGNWEMDRQSFAGSGGDNWVAGAQINLDILPLAKRDRLRQAEAARQKAEAEQRAQELQIRLAVERAYTGLQTAERSVDTARDSMQQAAESLRILHNRYDAGLTTMTDLLRAEDADRQSQNDYWRAAYSNAVAWADLLYATGRLTPDSAETLQ